MTWHYITIMIAIVGGIGVIAAGIWRVAGAVFELAYEVKLGSWRLDRIEKRLGVDDPPPPLPAAAAAAPRRRRAVRQL